MSHEFKWIFLCFLFQSLSLTTFLTHPTGTFLVLWFTQVLSLKLLQDAICNAISTSLHHKYLTSYL